MYEFNFTGRAIAPEKEEKSIDQSCTYFIY